MTNLISKRPLAAIVVAVSTLIFMVGCSSTDDSALKTTQGTTAAYMKAALKDVPYPIEEMKVGKWLERLNVRERLLRFSKVNKVSYLYTLSNDGRVMGFYTIKGKVSHVASQLTADQMPQDLCGGDIERCRQLANAPMDDGTWGPSETAIFWFTTDGVYGEWNGLYQLFDAPLRLDTPPVLNYIVGSKPSSIGEANSPINGGAGIPPAPASTPDK